MPSRSRTHASDDTRNAVHWVWEENILGVCTGWKQERPCVTFLVEKKIHTSRLTSLQSIPKLLRNQGQPDGVATDIVECDRSFQLQDGYQGTLSVGLPVGNEHGYGSGTLGLLVRSVGGAAGSEMILQLRSRLGLFSENHLSALPTRRFH